MRGGSSSRLWSSPFFHCLMEDTRDMKKTVLWQLFLFSLWALKTVCGTKTPYCLPVGRMKTAHLFLNREVMLRLGKNRMCVCVCVISAKAFRGIERMHERSSPAVPMLDSIPGQAEVKLAFYVQL